MPVKTGIYYHHYSKSTAQTKNPLVFIHGAGGDHLFWPPQLRRLPGYETFALDLPGHGKSSGIGQQTISGYTNALVQWLDSIEMNQAFFIGHSMGGAIVQDLTLKHPYRVKGIVLISTGAQLPANADLLDLTSSETTRQSAVARIVSISFDAGAPEKLLDLATKRIGETRLSVLHGDLKACSKVDFTKDLGQISCPALVMCGLEDRMTPPRYSQFLHDQIPDSCLEIVPGAGHMVMIEKPTEVNHLLAGFLEKHALM
jgi:pimeloyl-ACP methyl ester carboxylesterase